MERRDDRRRRDDTRPHKPRHEQDRSRSRSRSPPRRDRRDDRRRDRSPRRDREPPTGPSRPDPDKASDRAHRAINPSSAIRRAGERPPTENRPNGTFPKHGTNSRGRAESDLRMENSANDEDSEEEMQRVMGFKAFRTTQNTKVPGNDKNFAIHKVKTSEYRQYMNRTGGFNRPLSPSRS